MRGVPARLGLPGATAVLALLVALPLATVFTPRWQHEAQAARQQRAVPSLAPVRPVTEPTLPSGGDPAARVADLLELAVRHGVSVQRTQQRSDDSGTVHRLQLGLSARGRYADLRAFIAAALQADPALALDHLQLHRTAAAAAELEAELQWSLLKRPAPESAN